MSSDKQKIKPFLVFSDDFGEHPSSCQHIFRYISKNHKVLWVNTIGMRNPKLTLVDLKKSILKIRKMLIGIFLKTKNVTTSNVNVCQPLMLPFPRLRLVRKINEIFVVRSVQKKLDELFFEKPIIVVTAPNACDYIGRFKEEKVIYYCVDDFSEWPGLDRKLVSTMEDNMITQADRFIATSIDLKKRIEKKGKCVHLLTHGVDYEHFSKKNDVEHSALINIPKPRIGYFGLFDKRSNIDLIINVAKQLPNVSFVITGSIEVDKTDLEKIPNIYFTGKIPYTELPKMASGWDICMLPYIVNKLTDAIQPLKIKEYLSTGKPVISTPIKEAVRLQEYIILASSTQEWVDKIKLIISGAKNIDMEKRKEFLNNEGWESKSIKFLDICYEDNQ